MRKLIFLSILSLSFLFPSGIHAEGKEQVSVSWKEKAKRAFKGLWRSVKELRQKKAQRAKKSKKKSKVNIVHHHGSRGYPIQYYFPSLSGGRISRTSVYTGATLSQSELVFGTQACVLHCIDLATRKLRWRATFGKAFSGANPWISKSTVSVLTAYGGPFWGLDKETGALKWKHKPGERYYTGRFDFCDDILIYEERPWFGHGKGTMYILVAIDLEDGKRLWDKRHRYWYFIGAGVVIAQANNVRSVFDLRTGKRLWDVPQNENKTYAFKELMDYSDKSFAAIWCAKEFVLLDKTSGEIKLRWSGPSLMSEPKIEGDKIFFWGRDDTYWCYNIKSGKPLWRSQLKLHHNVWKAPLFACTNRIIIYNDGPDWNTTQVHALDKQTGEVAWSKVMSGDERYIQCTDELFISSNGVVVDAQSGKILKKLRNEAFRQVSTGRTVWFFDREGNLTTVDIKKQ